MVLQGLVLALLSSVSFGGNHAAARRGLVKGDVYSGVLLTLALGVPAFSLLALATGELSQLSTIPWLAVGYFLLAGVLHFAIGRTLTYASLQHAGVTQASPLLGTNSIYTVTLGILLLGEPASTKVIAAALLVVTGVILVSRQDHHPGEASPIRRVNRGVAYSILAGFIFGVTPLIVRAGLLLAPLPASAALISYTAALVPYTVALLLSSRRKLVTSQTLSPPLLAAALAVNSGQILRYYALSLAPASAVSTVINAFPLFALAFAYPGREGLETYSRTLLSGAALILTGVSLLYILP